MNKDLILVIIAVSLITFIYGYIFYSIGKSKNKNKYDKSKEMIEMEQREYQCFVCRNKFETSEVFENNHPLCSETCVAIYVDHGFNLKENNSMWANVYQNSREMSKEESQRLDNSIDKLFKIKGS